MATSNPARGAARDFATSPPAGEPTEWKDHEQITAPLKAQAERLVQEAGSPERAKHAVDAAAESRPVAAADKDEFARRSGFTSYLSMFEESTKVGSWGDKNWFITPLAGGGGWIVWNDCELAASQIFATSDEARQYIRELPEKLR